LAHAGRKASTQIPWLGTHALTPEQGGWRPIFAPSAVAFDERSPTPEAMSEAQIDQLILDYKSAASRSLAAGFDVVEVHAAHGYLLHEFLSPLSNQRTDSYGGSFENRIRLLKRVIASVREVWPERLPLWLRISASDWTPGGWDLDQSCALATALVGSGVDLIDVSSGGLIPGVAIPMGSGYQTPFAAEIRRQSGLMTGAVGLITGAEQADHIVRTGQADVVLLAREMLRDPYFPRRAARALGATIAPPKQYGRAW
jgi:2,4-dienoyl-CoA reductase-like NADH-dependent reductase (Old Yellow Enzyme family)